MFQWQNCKVYTYILFITGYLLLVLFNLWFLSCSNDSCYHLKCCFGLGTCCIPANVMGHVLIIVSHYVNRKMYWTLDLEDRVVLCFLPF